MIARLAAAAAFALLSAAPAVATPLAECFEASDNRLAVGACLDLRARAATGDLAAARAAAAAAAQRRAEATGRDAPVATLAASAAAFSAFVDAECARRAAAADAGTGAGHVEPACRARLRGARAETLWSEAGGRPAAGDAIRSRAWRLVRLDGEPVLDGTAPDLTLGEDDRAGGDASTNRWFAPYHLHGMGLAFGTTGTTMMFNDAPSGRMEQERRYLDMLAEVNRWRLTDAGRLALMAGDTTLLVFE